MAAGQPPVSRGWEHLPKAAWLGWDTQKVQLGPEGDRGTRDSSRRKESTCKRVNQEGNYRGTHSGRRLRCGIIYGMVHSPLHVCNLVCTTYKKKKKKKEICVVLCEIAMISK